MLAEECAESIDHFQRCLNSPKYTRALRFGAGRLAEAISHKLDKWIFTSLTPTGFETLCLMLDPNSQYIATNAVRALCLPGELCNTLSINQIGGLITSINKLRYLTKVSVNGTSQWLQIAQVKGYAHSHLLHMSGQADSGRMSAASASVTCGLALENYGVSDLNLSRNEFGEVGGRAAARLLMTNDRLQRVDLHDCRLGCLGLAEVSKGLIASAAGQLSSVALAFNLADDAISRELSPSLTAALANLIGSPLCPLELNLTANHLGSLLELEQFGKVATSLEARGCAIVDLNLSVNDLSDAFGEALGLSVARNATLTSLNLSTNRLGQKSSVAFARAVESPRSSLVSLNLVNNRLGESGGLAFTTAIENATELEDAAHGLLGRKGRLDLRNNMFGKAAWPLLAAADASPAQVSLDADSVRAYANARPLAKLRFAEDFARPRLPASPRDRLAMQRPATAGAPSARSAAPGAARPQQRRPRTAPSGDRTDRDMYTPAAVEAVVQMQREAQARLTATIDRFEAWVISKREVARGSDERAATAGGPRPFMTEPGSPNRITTSIHHSIR